MEETLTHLPEEIGGIPHHQLHRAKLQLMHLIKNSKNVWEAHLQQLPFWVTHLTQVIHSHNWVTFKALFRSYSHFPVLLETLLVLAIHLLNWVVSKAL